MGQTIDKDIVIAGAGMIGAALACRLLLRQPALRIAIVEPQIFKPGYSPTSFDPRVVALTAASRDLLQEIGVWSAITSHRYCAYTHMEVWDGEGTGHIHFDCSDVAEAALGYIVENSIVLEALLDRLKNAPVSFHCPASVSAINLPAGSDPALVILDDSSSMTTSLIVATDGAHSSVRKLANLETREWSYGHTAIICTVQTEKSHDFTARQSFTRHGPLAFLPLQDQSGDTHHCSIVWSVSPDYANTLLALTDDDFAAVLAGAFEHRLGKICHIAPRHSFPLQQRHCKEYYKPGLVVAGDAAHTIHPLAGQGVNLGFQDVLALSDEIDRAMERGIPFSDVSILQRYQRRRMGPNLAMMGAMEGFKQLFSRGELPLHWLRNEGMNQLDQMPFIKRQLIRQAMGL